jgi:hypothetical protein
MELKISQKSILIELLLIILAAVGGLFLGDRYDLFDLMYRHSRAFEKYQIDEIVVVFIVLAFGLGIFSFRRWREQVKEQAELQRLMAEKEEVIVALQDALQKIRILKGYLPICSHCKKIRDDEGHWQQLEKYISDHSEAQFSHGVCPICMRKYYGDDLVEKNDYQQ